jgi:hypothetical protein
VPAQLAHAHHVETVARADDLLSQVQVLRNRAYALLDSAEEAGDIRAAVVAMREVRECIALLAKVAGELPGDGTTVNVLVSSDWARLRSAIMLALAPHPEARIAVADALEHQS